ncbi:shikimate dehydrogenase [Staphylococcus sp. SQ8-PEA]|uniref:Shikimate dehydrogenase (NADP(+)) n=1 Tax=Staphylococcus marylandisciuri TaxID=2981529 RepID=A0ABT2QR08_9STAP|nr:shikimate dehydrogenase [Staphylococcus marylandisciuri]MCU5746413.1 shikimate dehydrogenase [Staphylococcus marylandisciuri]
MNFAVIGHPIDHSLSPIMHNENFKINGEDSTYKAIDIPEEQFHLIKEIVRKESLDGFNVTIPHKERIIPYLDEIDEQSRHLGAVNTVKITNGKWIGHNTDGIGYVKGLKAIYPDLENAYILMIGAGGASKGIANELYPHLNNKLTIANRTLDRFKNWSIDINAISLKEAERSLSEFDIVINTTPIGMKSESELIINLSNLDPDTLVSDIIYTPLKTAFLSKAEENGNTILNGLDMFINQGAESYKIWTGKEPNIKHMKKVVLKYL